MAPGAQTTFADGAEALKAKSMVVTLNIDTDRVRVGAHRDVCVAVAFMALR